MAKGTATQLTYPTDFTVDFSADAFDDFILTKGVPLLHLRAIPCPHGRVGQYDYRKPHEDHGGCSNGFLYREVGEIQALYTNAPNQLIQIDLGLLTGASVTVTFNRWYNEDAKLPLVDRKPFYAHTFDRLYLTDPSIVVSEIELMEVSGTSIDRCRFQVVDILELVDSSGNEYGKDDVEVLEGKLHWKGARRPAYDVVLNKGAVISIAYTYRPYLYVKQLLHEVRVSQVEAFDGSRQLVRLPQAAVLQRENAFESSEDRDQEAPNPQSLRQALMPPRFNLGPR